MENEDAVEAAPTGDAPTTFEWSAIYCLIRCDESEVWGYLLSHCTMWFTFEMIYNDWIMIKGKFIYYMHLQISSRNVNMTLPSPPKLEWWRAMASQITSLTSVYLTVYPGADQRKYQTSASLAFVWAINRWPVNSPHKWPVTGEMFPFDDVIM